MDILVVAELPHLNGLTEDSVVNTFAVKTAAGWTGSALDLGDVTIPIAQFYTQATETGNTVAQFIGSGVSRAAGACKLRVYNLAGALSGGSHGSPIAMDTFTMGPIIGAPQLPEEVAVVLTLRALGWQEAAVEVPDGADPGTAVDRIKSRLTGRIYVGPLTTGTVGASEGGRTRISPTFRDTVADSANKTFDLLNLNLHKWSVWSRAFGALSPLTHVQTDNAFDTQRRRGTAPTIRTTTIL